MKQEDKELLLKDLCGRLPYLVMIHITDDENHLIADEELYCINICQEALYTKNREFHAASSLVLVPIEYCKPYLRPMSSMTDEEANEWAKASNMKFDMEDGFIDAYDAHLSVDWLNAHHFDYRGLIEKGLSIEAPKNMYNVK